MDAPRLARIQDKLLRAEDRLGLFLEWQDGAAESLRDRLACYKALQQGAEALADAADAILKGLGVPPHDDYANYDRLHKRGALSDAALTVLTELNGRRNALVHDYDEISDARALDAAERLAPAALDVIEEVRAWLTNGG